MQQNLSISVNSRNSFKYVGSPYASEFCKVFRAMVHNVASAFGIFVILISVLFIFSEKASAQTFVCTDVVISDDYKIERPHKARRAKEALGAIANLEEYDNNVRLRLSEQGRDKEDAVIMEHQPNGTYLFIYNGDKTILSIDKVLGYYKGLKLEFCEGNKLAFTFIFKRK